MPRPRPLSIKEWEARLTPQNQTQVTDWSPMLNKINDENAQIIICEEGGTEECRLHYHLSIKTNASESIIRSGLSIVSGGTGNGAYSLKNAHSHSIGYIVKQGNVVFRLNYTDSHITEYMRLSNEYKQQLDASRKRVQRTNKDILAGIIKDAHARKVPQDPHDIYDHLETAYEELKMPLPSRSIIEYTIVNYVGGAFRRRYYLKTFSFL
jgi:hypothetical protein